MHDRPESVEMNRRAFVGNLLASSVGTISAFFSQPSIGHATTSPPPPTRTIVVGTGSQLSAALANALPGDHIVLNDGRYSGTFSFSRSGTPERPIVIRAANLGRAILASPITFAGSDIWLVGTTCTSDRAITIRNDRIHLLRNVFLGRAAIQLSRASECNIGYNHFNPPADPPNTTLSDIRIDLSSSDIAAGRPSRFNKIFRNLFNSRAATDPASYRNSNHGIYVFASGLSNYPATNNVIEFNLFAHDRLRPIYLKYGGNIVRFNTILRSPNYDYVGMMCCSRYGSGDQWVANHFENSHGLYIHGSNHQILGNVFAGSSPCKLYLMAGDNAGTHPPAVDCLAAGNTGRLVVGAEYYPGSGPFRFAERNRIEAHLGSVAQTGWARNTVVLATTTKAVPSAAKLSLQAVGPSAR